MKRRDEYLEESRQDFLDRMHSQNPARKQTEEEKKRAEQFLKEIEEYEIKHS